MPYRFHAVPTRVLEGAAATEGERLAPDLADLPLAAEALVQAEYRGESADRRARRLLAESGRPPVYARSPGDLPALLRTADQLLAQAKAANGEQPRLGQCRCGAPYAVPVLLVPPATVRCDRCGDVVELDTPRQPGRTQPVDERTRRLNEARRALAAFFREAMARGWPVLVSKA